MANILITGGCGFLGRNLIQSLSVDGHCVTCVDRYEAPFLREFGVKFLSGDISEKNFITESLAGVDVVIHLACTILPQMSNSDPLFDVSTNVGGTLMLLDAAVKNKVKKVLFLSSGGTVYGVPKETPIPETHSTHPTCSYGITKLTIEKYLRLYSQMHGLQTCAIRLSNPYGPFQRVKSVQGVIPVFCYKALNNETIEIWGDGEVKRDFIYIDDVVRAVKKMLISDHLPYEVNIGSGRAVSINELVMEISKLIGRDLKCKYLARRGFDVPLNMLDIQLAQKTLGWTPLISLKQGLEFTIPWIRSNMKGI